MTIVQNLMLFVAFCKNLVSNVCVSSRSRHVQVSVSSQHFAQSFGLVMLMFRLDLKDFGRDSNSEFEQQDLKTVGQSKFKFGDN